MLEVVNDALSVQKVHCRRQKVPIQRFGETQVLLLIRDIGDGDNFLEGDDLDSGNESDDIDVPREQRDEETGDHYEGPYRPGDEGLLLLLVFGLRRLLYINIALEMYSECVQSYYRPLPLLLRVWGRCHSCWGSRALKGRR